MSAPRDQIFQLALARLIALPDAAETELMPSADPISFPARHIFDGGQSIEESGHNFTMYRLGLTVEGYLERDGGTDVHQQLNAFYAATVAALVSDPPLDGLAETIDEGDMRVMVAPLAGTNRLAFALDFSVTFFARRDDPAQPA